MKSHAEQHEKGEMVKFRHDCTECTRTPNSRCPYCGWSNGHRATAITACKDEVASMRHALSSREMWLEEILDDVQRDLCSCQGETECRACIAIEAVRNRVTADIQVSDDAR